MSPRARETSHPSPVVSEGSGFCLLLFHHPNKHHHRCRASGIPGKSVTLAAIARGLGLTSARGHEQTKILMGGPRAVHTFPRNR